MKMIKIFRSAQIKAIDEFTIQNEPITSLNLMERASSELFNRIAPTVDRNDEIVVFAGTGNNGGDGLAIARMLKLASYRVVVYVVKLSQSASGEWKENLKRFNDLGGTGASLIEEPNSIPIIPASAIVIDAIFGSGLTRSPEGLAAAVIRTINSSGARVIAIDVPSGLAGEDNSSSDRESIVRVSRTLAIQFPRLSFMFPENFQFTGEWSVVPIGLHPHAIASTETPFYYTDSTLVASFLKSRRKSDHKGDFGHALLIAGSKGKMGAAILSARAALRSGVGLLTCHIPDSGNDIMQIAVPEAMTEPDQSDLHISEIPDPHRYDGIAIGPGVGTTAKAQKALHKLLTDYGGPLVVDADAINMLGMNCQWLDLLPVNSILTPHPKEFSRIAGASSNGYVRLLNQIDFSQKHKCIVVLKGSHTSVTLPDGRVFFNSTGNPGMATAGSGDVLTGIILGLLAQGYEPEKAAITAVYLHGLAGDIATSQKCEESIIASDITETIFAAYTRLRENVL
jgi:ADP-dependent NAD(P)H-hydrate dehydratase / NAD(P)H-hydrate epimerase